MPLEFTVDDSVTSLGIAFFSLPPGAVAIKRVVPESWAEGAKLQAEDEVVSVNGCRVADMTREEFRACIQERPLQLKILRPSDEKSTNGVATPPLAERANSDESTPQAAKTLITENGTKKVAQPTANPFSLGDILMKLQELCCCARCRDTTHISRRATVLVA
mmetsp:Transcript_110577/g.276947  ORF Transcript_110577/g.276947 Transcript_110577/m.276947 type:complete len:162 (+) Transcript_110577:74-559(+)